MAHRRGDRSPVVQEAYLGISKDADKDAEKEAA